MIQLLRDKEGLSFEEACEKAGLSGKGKGKMDPERLLRRRTNAGFDEKQLTLFEAIEALRPLMLNALGDPLPSAYLSFRAIPQDLGKRQACLYRRWRKEYEAR